MFAKFHHHQQQYQQHHHHQLTLDHPHQQQQHHQISEEDRSDSRSSEGGGGGGSRSISISNKKTKTEPKSSTTTTAAAEEGGSIEVAGKRPRGRPPGSKNKPKPPLIITRDTTTECAMRPLFLELPTGIDVIDAIARFTHKRNIGLTVLSASGSVTNVSLRQPSVTSTTTMTSGSTVILNGSFEILSISATFLPPSLPIRSSNPSSSPPLILPSSFMISLVGPQGQIIGGSVAGSFVTAGTVFIIAAGFDNPSFHRLPIEDDTTVPQQVSISSEDHHHHQIQNHHDSSNNPTMVDNCGMSMYHVSTPDLIWTPTPRPPQPQVHNNLFD